MLIATAVLALPKTLLTAVGIVEKKAQFAAPLITTNAISGGRDVEAGQTASMVTAVNTREMVRVLSEPSLSQAIPEPMRPRPEAILKPATSVAPTLDENPIDLAYIGMKKGGTKSGNVPRALPRNTRSKFKDLNKRLAAVSGAIETGIRENSPFDKPASSKSCPFSYKPRRWEPGGQCHDAANAIGPGRAQLLDECIEQEAVRSTAETTAGEHQPSGQTSLPAKVLRRYGSNDLGQLVRDAVTSCSSQTHHERQTMMVLVMREAFQRNQG